MANLTLIANKLPVRPIRAGTGWRLERGEGGLVAALTPLLQEHGGVWVGTGAPSEGWDVVPGRVGYQVLPIDVPARIHKAYYSGFCNATLWPLFHDFLSRARFDPAWWAAYREVNRTYAERIDADLNADDLWVHDYHFLLLPGLLRAARRRRYIRFFLHIPFPAFEIYRHLPWRNEILEGMIGADEVGFHTELYQEQFLAAVQRLLGPGRVQGKSVIRPDGRGVCHTRVMPISVDTEALAARSREKEVGQRVRELSHAGVRLVLGVDRLDYTKGLPERLHAVAKFFERYPERVGKVTFVQIAVPSREEVEEYNKHKRAIEELVGRINGTFGTPEWSPIRYLHRHVPVAELVALYRAADVALVTPLCDGMNLVAKEYVACKAGDPGVLVLSEFAGAASELREALLVNPHHIEQVAETLETALRMPRDERRRRMAAMYEYLRRNTIHHWVRGALRPPAARAA